MLQETEYRIENIKTPLDDLDVNDFGDWVGITNFSGEEQSLYFGETQILLPERIEFPIVRSIDKETALILNTRALNQNNGWIIKSDGEVKANFFAGDAIEDAVICKDFIAITYFDEAACYGDGICIYDHKGNLLFGYEELFGKESVSIYDCYAAALVKENQIIFCPYTGFQLVLFNVETKTQQIWETPAIVHGFSAITKLGDKIYFHNSYNDRFGIYEWRIGSKKAERIGEYPDWFVRGLPDGKFLAKGDSGYTIISLQ